VAPTVDRRDARLGSAVRIGEVVEMGRRGMQALAVAVLAVLTAGTMSACQPPPPAVRIEAVVPNLDFPAGFTLDPNNATIWYAERNTGEVRRRNVVNGNDQLVWTVPNLVTSGEQGLLGIALHPQYPSRPFVFVYASRSIDGVVHNQVLRITLDPNNGFVGTGQSVLFDQLGGPGDHHVGGRLAAGPDGNLWFVIGEHTVPANAQNLGSTSGKILRMATSGSPPSDNPFSGKRIYAYGIRNSFGFDFDPVNGRLWATDNGPTCNDEVDLIVAGGNYGWGPNATCSTPPAAPQNTNRDGPSPRQPITFYATPSGVTGAAFCDDCGINGLDGKLLFGAVNTGNIRVLTLNGDRTGVSADQLLVDHSAGILSMETRPGQPVYFSTTTGIFRLVAA
jgi:glucose/arabinose dehydrogenase